MTTHPREPRIVHRLPPAPNFVGRTEELQALRNLWQTGRGGVLALVGLGGAGKTAVAARFLDDLLGGRCTPPPDGLFVWSFYEEPDPGRFMQDAYQYFARADSAAVPGKGTGLLQHLAEALAKGGPHLLVLDGLEKVQRQSGAQPGVFGSLEDPLLKGLLARFAEGVGDATVLVTSRFPLTDLDSSHGREYRRIDVGGLELPAALDLLRQRGVRGDDASLGRLVESYGAHALTLDHLGSLLGQFLDGDPSRAPEVPALTAPGDDRQALRLVRLLRAYEEHLPPVELTLLCQLCLLRRSVAEEQIKQLFLCSPAVHARTVREIREMIVHISGSDKSAESLRVDLADSISRFIEEALCSGPIAGPEETFRQEIRRAAETVVELYKGTADADFAELARLYSDKDLDVPTALRPLSAADREALRALYGRYVELRSHPLMPYQDLDPALEAAFQKTGHRKKLRGGSGELSTSDILQAFQKVHRRLRYLTYKHFALRRVRDLCRLYQRKWSLAGPLASLESGSLRQVLKTLTDRHLVLHEAADSFSVHPAVRDHFARLAAVLQPESWHDLIREQLVSLSQRPGMTVVEKPALLDLVEEAIYHAIQSGRTEEAVGLYNHVLGGVRQLGWKLGEMSRGLRILREFSPCPEPWDVSWYLRALGELEEAYQQHPPPFFRADLRLLQGRLPDVAAEGDEARTATAAFLMGRATTSPPDLLGYAIPRAQILLYLGRLDSARQAAQLGTLYHAIGWEGERARCHLLLAEVARRQADPGLSQKHLNVASEWILHSGSVEHLCLLHLVQSRAARSAGDLASSGRAVEEGIHTARQCGLGLYYIELLCDQGELYLAQSQEAPAEDRAREALRRAAAADCQFSWGAAAAGHLLGQALLAQQRFREADSILRETLAMRRRIGDPRADETEHLLALEPRRESPPQAGST